MARTFSLFKTTTYLSTTSTAAARFSLRSFSTADQSDSTAASDPLIRKLEDAIHQIVVQRSAPDWLPFLPGYSYWVPPPKSQAHGIAQLVERLANPMTYEESMSVTSVRGWPSSDYFIKGGLPHPVEEETLSKTVSKPEDEEGLIPEL